LSNTIKNETDEEINRDYNKKDYAFLGVGMLIVGILVYFSSGYFAYHAVAIATGSMSPNINRGDIVIIHKDNYGDIEVGDVIAYDYHQVLVVHRVSKKVKVDDGFYYYSKGDANNNEDNYIIKSDMIEGKVKFRIPYLGMPTVWLNKLWED
jgi:signal peptidase